jgi:hypothetical protein
MYKLLLTGHNFKISAEWNLLTQIYTTANACLKKKSHGIHQIMYQLLITMLICLFVANNNMILWHLVCC